MQLGKGAGGAEAGLVQGGDHVQLAFFDVAHEELAEQLLELAAAEHVHIGDAVVDLEDHEVRQARHHRLGPLVQEELLELVVAQGRELDVDLTHHADPDLLLAGDGDGLEVGANLVKDAAHLLAGHAVALVEAVQQLRGPVVHVGGGVAGVYFIGADLVGHVHDEVAVHHAVDEAADEAHGPVEAGVFLQAEGEGDDGDIV